MKRAIILTVLLGLLLASTTAALEPGDTLWTRTYGGIRPDWGRCVSATTDGGYVIAAGTMSAGPRAHDVYLVKTGDRGDTLWTRLYDWGATERTYSVQQTIDGGYALTGETFSFDPGYGDIFLLKTDGSGETEWIQIYGGRDLDCGYTVRQTSDGGYIIAGYTWSFGNWNDICLVKTDAWGDTLWTRLYGGYHKEFGRCMEVTSDGGYIVVGETHSFGAGEDDVYVVRTDAFGDTVWTRTYGGSNYDGAWSVQQTNDGGYIIAGWTYSFGAGDSDLYLVKTDTSGDTLWTRAYGGWDADWAQCVKQTTDGGYIVTGVTFSFAPGRTGVYLVRTDSLGDTLWTRSYGGSDDDRGYSVLQASDGDYLVAGYTSSFGTDSRDVYLLKIAGEQPRVLINCQVLTSLFCRGKDFYFKLGIDNSTGGNVSGTLTFSGYAGYDCDPRYVLAALPRSKTYPPGVTEKHYFFKVPNDVQPGQYSASVGGTLSGYELFCCMDADIVECEPWKPAGNTEWDLVEVDRPDVAVPTAREVYQNYPNPFNASTVIEYQLPEASDVKLEVYNLMGEKVATLVDSEQQAGYRSVVWDTSNISSGLYFYKLSAGDFTETKRMILVK